MKQHWHRWLIALVVLVLLAGVLLPALQPARVSDHSHRLPANPGD